VAKKRGVQKLLKSAFKRGEHAPGAPSSGGSATASGGYAEEDACLAAAQDLSRSSSSSAGGSSGRKGRRNGGGVDDGSADGERSSHDSLDLEGALAVLLIMSQYTHARYYCIAGQKNWCKQKYMIRAYHSKTLLFYQQFL
jgi:hypothetical protein